MTSPHDTPGPPHGRQHLPPAMQRRTSLPASTQKKSLLVFLVAALVVTCMVAWDTGKANKHLGANSELHLEQQIGADHSAHMPDGKPRGYYHHTVFSETDNAIGACDPNTRWFTATNGDNAYDPSFWSEVAKAPESAEALAFDFYSRFHRATSRQCSRFEASQSPLLCKENLLRVGHTDLAALVLDWKKWTKLNLGYARLPELTNHEKYYGLHDGLAAQHVAATGWKIHWVEAGSRCLLAHSPNPQLCAMEGGVWDDREKDTSGGKCLSMKEGLTASAEDVGVELVKTRLSHEPTSFQQHKALTSSGAVHLPAWSAASNYTILCLRTIDEVPAVQAMAPTQYHQITPFTDEDPAVLAIAQKELQQVFAPNADDPDTIIQAARTTYSEYQFMVIGVIVMLIGVTAASESRARMTLAEGRTGRKTKLSPKQDLGRHEEAYGNDHQLQGCSPPSTSPTTLERIRVSPSRV